MGAQWPIYINNIALKMKHWFRPSTQMLQRARPAFQVILK